jgi:hypothetical protein
MKVLKRTYFEMYVLCYGLLLYDDGRWDKRLGATGLVTIWQFFIGEFVDQWLNALFNVDIGLFSKWPMFQGVVWYSLNLYGYAGKDRGAIYLREFWELPKDVRRRKQWTGYILLILTFILTFFSMWILRR